MPFRTPVFKTGAIAILPALRIGKALNKGILTRLAIEFQVPAMAGLKGSRILRCGAHGATMPEGTEVQPLSSFFRKGRVCDMQWL